MQENRDEFEPASCRREQVTMLNYIAVGAKPCDRCVFDEVIASLIGTWNSVTRREEVAPDKVANIASRNIFSLHWLWEARHVIIDNCVCSHMGDMPYGHGVRHIPEIEEG